MVWIDQQNQLKGLSVKTIVKRRVQFDADGKQIGVEKLGSYVEANAEACVELLDREVEDNRIRNMINECPQCHAGELQNMGVFWSQDRENVCDTVGVSYVCDSCGAEFLAESATVMLNLALIDTDTIIDDNP